MITNITQVVFALRILKENVTHRDAAGKIEMFATAHYLLSAIESNLDHGDGCHRHTIEIIGRIRTAFEYLCGFSKLPESENISPVLVGERIESSLIMLNQPSLWPSKCTLVDHTGTVLRGTSDPR